MRGHEDRERSTVERAREAPMLAQVERWASVNSGTRNLAGLATMAGLLADAFAVLPGDIRLIEPEPVETVGADGIATPIDHGRHLLLSVRPEAERRLLFTGHMDTVYPVDHPFQSLSWRSANELVGPGVADMKGGLAVLLAALAAVEAAGVAIGYDVLINSDEETGSLSSRRLIERNARGKLAALTYEPALPDGTLAGARGGTGNFSIIVRGRSAHAGRNPEEGRNALVAAAALAVRLAAAAVPGLTVNPARIDGGGPNNVVPDLAVLRVNFRPRHAEAIAAAQAALDQAAAAIAAEHDVQVAVHGSFNRPPKPVDTGAARLFALVERCGADLGLTIARRDTGGVCDGNNIAAAGVPVIDTMGVRGGAIHSPDEYLLVDSLAERAGLSALTILRLAEEGLA
ncbi:glutamate carboxypeptidase [Sphingomonas sp. SORGH_AS802]|uniref:hydrolase n=1 Tax=unclassified Sphingomonas TaxID=196159 RepID=UPI00285B9CA4|nr:MULTISPECIES: hydrolase [unclassified Sphingomonas]MDR6126257.1 glutamate carboxypeptidase [Sphingomonas sp. SORGH_AS_0438]MDR6135897.1 glutamate carboxypeptidase [Sphingomonas sp. SORGH_AS_0802]